MKKKPLLITLLCVGLVMLCSLLLADHRHEQEIKAADREYPEGRSLFEDIVINYSGSFGTALTEDREDSSAAEDSLSSRDRNSDPSAPEAPLAVQEIRLHLRREGKWEAYVPADLAEKAYVRFEHFGSLVLSPAENNTDGAGSSQREAGSDSGSSEKTGGKETPDTGSGAESDGKSIAEKEITLHSGDILRCGKMENGSKWHAKIIGRDKEVLEEADLSIYYVSDVPTLYITTATGSLESVDADRSVRENCRYLVCTEDGKKDASGRCVIHGRGNSSWKEDKKQYSINLASDREILGMDNARKFALIANHSDSSNLRNKTVFDLAELMRMPFSPGSVFVNVYCNGDYHGLYLLAQRPNAKGGSVRIRELEKENEKLRSPEEDGKTEPPIAVTDEEGLELHASAQEKVPANITGGYLLEIDGRYEEEDYWFSTKTHHFVVKYPEEVPLPEGQYIAKYLREAEKALFSEDGINPDTGESWEEYFDIQSWAKMYLLQDFMVQWDVESFSFFVCKDADDTHLYCGPVWDFDLSMGTTGLGRLPNVTRYSVWLRDHREGWLTELEKFPAFTDALRTIADEQFFPVLEQYIADETDQDVPGIQVQKKALAESSAMDARRWGESNDFIEGVEKLTDWLRDRSAFWQGYDADPSSYCTLTLRYGFNDMDIYVPRGEPLGFVPTEEYGEHLYSSFRKKYGSIDGWTCEDGSVLTPETVIDRDQVCTPFTLSEDSEK